MKDIPPRALNAGETAMRAFAIGFQSDRKPDHSNRIMRHITLLVDRHIDDYHKSLAEPVACKPGCNYCCHSRPVATVPEILYLFDGIKKTFSQLEIEGLVQRIEEFEIAVSQSKYHRATPKPCPLLVDGLCSAYEFRPILCRMMASTDAGVCRSILEDPGHAFGPEGLVEQTQIGALTHQGIRQAMHARGCPEDLYIMTLSLKLLLTQPDLAGKVLEGSVALPKAIDRTYVEFPVAPGEVHAQLVTGPELTPLRRSKTSATIRKALESLDMSVPLHAMGMLTLPDVYESQEELLEERERIERSLDRLIETKWDPVEMYTALAGNTLFELPYQGLSVRKTLSRQGDWICGLAAKTLPHLVTPIEGPRKPGKLRVGYMGTRIRHNNGANWAVGWLENHCDEIESYALLTGDVADHVTNHFRIAADNFFWLQGNVQRAAEFVKGLDLDVLIYPGLGMNGIDYQYASLRLARAQCTAWGHPVTCGLPTIDYYLSSDLMEPEGAEEEYSERLVRLPRSGLCMRNIHVPPSNKTRQELGLPDGPFVFMGQKLSKWTPERDHLFKEIYDRSGWPIVTVFSSPVWEKRLEQLGIEYRVLGFLPPEDYDTVLRLAQVSIDPIDWSGGNSTILSLTVGTPVVTLPGPYMRGRHSYAFLKLVGADGLIAADEADFVDLATSPDRHGPPMEGLEPEILYEDKDVVKALDTFLFECGKNAR